MSKGHEVAVSKAHELAINGRAVVRRWKGGFAVLVRRGHTEVEIVRNLSATTYFDAIAEAYEKFKTEELSR